MRFYYINDKLKLVTMPDDFEMDDEPNADSLWEKLRDIGGTHIPDETPFLLKRQAGDKP